LKFRECYNGAKKAKEEILNRLAARIASLLLFALFVAGCSSKKAPEPRIVIPPPPEEPRLVYITSYRGESSFGDSKALDLFLGKEQKGGYKTLRKPYGVFAKGDILYVTDTAYGFVFVIDTAREKVTFLGDKAPGKLSLPVSVTMDAKGVLYVSDAKLKKVFGYDKEGNLVYAIGHKGEFQRPAGIAVDKKRNRLYVVDVLDHKVKVYDLATNKKLFEFGGRGVEEGRFNFPTNIVIDPKDDTVAVVDTQNFRVQIFDMDGEFITTFGRLGRAPGLFSRPKGIGVDSEGHYYVADAAFNNVQIFDKAGRLLLYFGGAGFEPGKFYLPAGVYVDERDRVYIVDSFPARVQVFQYISERWKKEHPEEYRKLKEIGQAVQTKEHR